MDEAAGHGGRLASAQPDLQRLFAEVSFAATIAHPLASRWHTELPVYVCRHPRGPIAELWPELKRYRHQSLLP